MEKVELNKIYLGDTLEVLKSWPDEFVDCIVTSPPYWGLRDYGVIPIIWNGDKICVHEFETKKLETGQSHWNQGGKVILQEERIKHNGQERQFGFCKKCNAWLGCLGLESTPELFV